MIVLGERMRSQESAFLSLRRNEQVENPTTVQHNTQLMLDHVSSEPSWSLSLASIAQARCDSLSPTNCFITLLKHLEKEVPGGYRTSGHSLQTKEDWIELSRKGHQNWPHTQECRNDKAQDIHRYRERIQQSSEAAFEALYEEAELSKSSTSSAEDIVLRARCHTEAVRVMKRALPLALSWNDDDALSLDTNVGQICRYYSRTYSMALLPYLVTASRQSGRNTTTEIPNLTPSQHQLVEIASKCISAAFRCAEISPGLNTPTSHACEACKVHRDQAIHE